MAVGTAAHLSNHRATAPQDEFDSRLTHDARGVLSMANTGPNTNRAQFFILFRPQPHLNGKHVVFGRAVGGIAALDAVERVGSNSGGTSAPVVIEACTVEPI